MFNYFGVNSESIFNTWWALKWNRIYFSFYNPLLNLSCLCSLKTRNCRQNVKYVSKFSKEFRQVCEFSMETDPAIIEDTKKQKEFNFQQCRTDEIIEVPDSPSPTELLTNSGAGRHSEEDATAYSEVVFINNIQEEPIDLTFDRSQQEEYYKFENLTVSNPKRIIIQPKPQSTVTNTVTMSSSNGSSTKRNMDHLYSANQENIMPNWNQVKSRGQNVADTHNVHGSSSAYSYAVVHAPQPDLSNHLTTRQQEVLKMAKSIFSKRTRTLYHWMYPTASKQQIKQVVSSTWDSMGAQEKNIYIAQVLGRFGCNNANLMVNPQLGQIKELPPACRMPEFNPKASELQNAISSISNQTDSFEPCYTINQPRKKQRVTKKRLVQNLSSASQEFDDDPELSQELAQFSMMLKNQF